jgi:Rv2258c-like winged HTH domain
MLPTARPNMPEALVERLFAANLATYDLATIYLCDRLGLHTALHESGPLTAARLAARTGTHERYVREWLEQQTVTGILAGEDAQADATVRRYRLPAGHAEALLARDSLNYLTPLGRFTIGVLSGLPRVLEAFKTDRGVA